MRLDHNFRSAVEYPESWKYLTMLFEGRDRQRPFLVIEDDTLHIADSSAKVKRYRDDSIVLKQWEGEYRSDWFYATVAQFREKFDK